LPSQTFYNVLGFILHLLTPVAHERVEMPYDNLSRMSCTTGYYFVGSELRDH